MVPKAVLFDTHLFGASNSKISPNPEGVTTTGKPKYSCISAADSVEEMFQKLAPVLRVITGFQLALQHTNGVFCLFCKQTDLCYS